METSSSHSCFSLLTNTNPNNCFFCLLKEPDSSSKRDAIKDYLKSIPFIDNEEELILVVSWLWNNAMTQPNDPQKLTFLGIFECMAYLINKAIIDKSWLLKNQNVFIPYYAAHVIGSYTMRNVNFSVRALESGVIPPLLELLRGKMTWVEQRVAVRALGHLASYEETFESIALYGNEIVELVMGLASSCLEVVYNNFVGVSDWKRRLKYHCDLLTRGVGGVEMGNRKAEEWASQIQCWSIHLLNCFAMKRRCLGLICKKDFLKGLCEMWGGIVNHSSPGGVGLIRILCYSRHGRESISRCGYVVESLCRLAKSSENWQYMGIDCLLLLLRDPLTRNKVVEVAITSLVDLIELRRLDKRSNVGEEITRAVFDSIKRRTKIKDCKAQSALEEIWNLKIERRKREKCMSGETLDGKRIIVKLLTQEGNHKYLMGKTEDAMIKYTQALDLCPLRYRNERMVLCSNRAQCNLVLTEVDGAISDATRALCLCDPPNSHANSLWIRSQAYEAKGMAKESLMDCVMFIDACVKSKTVKIPHCAIRMISKQMDSTWLFRPAQLKALSTAKTTKTGIQNKSYIKGLSTIVEEPSVVKDGSEGNCAEENVHQSN